MSKSITQDMAYRQSLMKYAEKYGVSRASRKYNKSRSYIYFWRARWDGRAESLASQSRRPHSHPNQHTEAELKLIRDMRRRNPNLGMVELWHRLRQRGYTRRPESLFRVMRKLGLFPPKEKKTAYKPKPYQQMTYPGQRVQVDVKVVPRRCITDPELRLYQYTAIDEFTRLRFLAAYPEQSTFSSADFLDTVDKSVVLWYNEEKRTGVFLHGEQLSTARYVRCDVGNSQAVHNRKQGNVGRERKGYPSISEWRVLDFENGSTMERPAAGIW